MKKFLSILLILLCLKSSSQTFPTDSLTNYIQSVLTNAAANLIMSNSSTATTATNALDGYPLVSSSTINSKSFYGFGNIIPIGTNPVLTAKAPYATVRDQSLLFFRGLYCLFYTEADNPVTMVNIGLATSPDLINWTDWGAMIDSNSIPSPFTIAFSPSMTPDGDVLHMMITVDTNSSQWYGGPHQIYVRDLQSGESFTNKSSYTGGWNLALDSTLAGSDGNYAPSKMWSVSNVWYCKYSIHSNSVYSFCMMTNSAADPTNAWGRAGFVETGHATDFEEPDVLILPDNSVLTFGCADVSWKIACPVTWTTDPTGKTFGGTFQFSFIPPVTWGVSGNFGSTSALKLSDGTYAMSISHDDTTGRSIGLFRFILPYPSQAQFSLNLQQINTLVVGSVPNTDFNRLFGWSYTNLLYLGGRLYQKVDLGLITDTSCSNYLGSLDLIAFHNEPITLKFSDYNQSNPYLYVRRDNGAGSTSLGNNLAIGTSVEFDIRGGSGDVTTQTNAMTYTPSGGFNFIAPVSANVSGNFLITKSNSWSAAFYTNGMPNFSSALVSSNGIPAILYLSNGVVYLNYFVNSSGGILP